MSNKSETYGELYSAKAIEVVATRLEQDCVVHTLEGSESAKVGDWVVTGVIGEKWPISEASLLKKYTKIGPNKFRKKSFLVWASQLSADTTIETSWGQMKGRPGDWIITEQDEPQKRYICRKDVFKQTYEKV